VLQASITSLAPLVAPPGASDTDAAASGASPTPAQSTTANGTVVLNVETGIVVPSFMGKSLRSAVESAQQSGLEINAVGSGIARQQSPPPGSHLLTGQKVTVRFSH
jgi:beta-lactam-binding protein with PASTA domain